MTALILRLGIAMLFWAWPVAAGGQEPTIVYRADVAMVHWNHGFYGPNGPITDLTAANFAVKIDKKVSVSITVIPSPETPGSYNVYFSPPESLRDGKKHRIDVTVLNVLPKIKAVKLKATHLTFEKPSVR